MKPPIDHFGILAPFYEHFIQPRIPDKLMDLVNLPENGILLDAGGGTGRISQFFRDQATQVIVADQTPKMLQEVKKKTGLLPVCSDVERLPFGDNVFDPIIMVDAFHHVVDQVNTANELWRLLKPGGWIVIEEPDIDMFSVKLIAIAEKMALMRSHFLSPRQIASLFNIQKVTIQIEVDGATAWIVVKKMEENYNL